jgi:hypothetical protein
VFCQYQYVNAHIQCLGRKSMKRYLVVPLLVGPLVLATAACGASGGHPQGASQPPPASSSTPATSPAISPTTETTPTAKANPAPITESRTPSAPPLLWPATTTAQLSQLQDATLEGHQPWLCDPAAVVEAYGRGPLNWPEPTVHRLHDDVYEVDGPAGARATVTVFKASGHGCVWEITKAQRG